MEWEQIKARFASLLFASFTITVLAVLVGRMATISEQIRSGQRRFWDRDILWEIPTVLFVSFVAFGLAEWLALPQGPSLGLASVLGWLGPRIIERVVLRYIATVSKGQPQ